MLQTVFFNSISILINLCSTLCKVLSHVSTSRSLSVDEVLFLIFNFFIFKQHGTPYHNVHFSYFESSDTNDEYIWWISANFIQISTNSWKIIPVMTNMRVARKTRFTLKYDTNVTLIKWLNLSQFDPDFERLIKTDIPYRLLMMGVSFL